MVEATGTPRDEWTRGQAYEPFVGRWSRLIASEFINWLSVAAQASWMDVGSGTGALSETILNLAEPKSLRGIDRSQGYVDFARGHVRDARARFESGDAQLLPVESDTYDAAVSGLVLNFVPEPARMVAEMRRVVRPGGTVGLYVWDYAGKMQFMRHFWNAAGALDPAARDLDEGRRFPICQPDKLIDLFQTAGLTELDTEPIEIETYFKDFDDYWAPFLGGQGPAPSYAMSLNEEARARLRERIRAALPFAIDGSIPLVARAWAVKGHK
ncbi:MAG: class I SAM-dependent methyltransferase [Anaerolineales bacterium]